MPVTICHDVNGNGNTGNGYNIITVDADSIVRQGHTNHGGGLVDIIPPFTYYTLEGTGQDRFWQEHNFPGQGDASLIADNCGPSGPPPEPCPDGDHNGDADGCGEPPVDVCPNIDDDQAEVPPGMVINDEGMCVPEVEPGGGGGTEEPNGSGPGVTVAGEQASASGAGPRQAAAAGAPAAPSNVDAGLAPAPTGPDGTLLALGLVGFGLLLMIGAGLPGLVRTGRR